MRRRCADDQTSENNELRSPNHGYHEFVTMLTDHSVSKMQAAGDRAELSHGSEIPARRRRVVDLLGFGAGLALVLLYALRGGSYDVVVFEEYGLVIWWVLALGIALGLLPRTRPPLIMLLLLGAVLAYSGWTALSLLWTESAEQTTLELARSLDYLGLIAILAFTLGRDTWRPAAAGVGFGALLVCVLAVASRLWPGAFPTDYVAGALQTDRLSYPFGYWNAVAAWGAMSTAIGLAWSSHDASAVRRAVALGLVPAAGLATYLSYSRAGAAGTALAVIVVIGLSRSRATALLHTLIAAGATAIPIFAVRAEPAIANATGTHGAASVFAALIFAGALCAGGAVATRAMRADRWAVPRAVLQPLTVTFVIALLVSGAVFGPHLIRRGWHSFTHPVTAQGSNTNRLLNLSGTRYLVWKSALNAFDQSPATGIGAGTFQFWWNRHGTTYEFAQDAHNIWLENLAELGAPGLLLIVGVAGCALVTAIAVRRRTRRRASIGASTAFLAAFIVYLVHASVDWMWESTAVTVLALAGIATIGARLAVPARRLGWRSRVPLSLLAVGAAVLQVPGLVSTIDIRNSQAAERAGNASLALARANDAVDAEPWAASAYEQRGLILESAGRLTQAADDLRRAIAHERTNFAHWLVLARIETESGQLSTAVRDYQLARSLRPQAAVFAFAPYFKTR
jgi:hypothetical protein